jgi:pimeloyl-ACP methyl ester carboxylesterase
LHGTVLLVMGATASMVWWPESLVTRLVESGYQVIQFDHRDTGQSTTNPLGDIRYDLSDLTSDLIAILDAYWVAKAHLVGVSLGGYLAQIAALTRPERVGSLTLISSEPVGVSYEGEGISPEFMRHFENMAELDWTNHVAVELFMLRIAELSAGSEAAFDLHAAKRRVESELGRTSSMQSAFNHSMLAGEVDPHLNVSKLDLPVLIIHGSNDPIISIAAARASASAINGGRLLVLDGRGHEMLEADMPMVAEAILELAGRN